MTDDWILALYHRYVELYGEPAPSDPLPLREGTQRGEDSIAAHSPAAPRPNS